jgi:glycosyltransferase involved in cell wall biosynthesis
VLDGQLSLVIPAHNERDNVGPLLREALTTLPDLAPSFEIILVDDASTDDTAAMAHASMTSYPEALRVIRHERQAGALHSVADGLRAAGGSYVAYIDGDRQFRVQDLALLAGRLADADLVAGWRVRRADPWFRSVISRVFNLAVRVLYGIRYRDIDCGIKIMRRTVLDAASPLLGRSACLNAELYFKTQRSGLRIAQLSVPHYPRAAGIRSGGRLIPILRATKELVGLRWHLAREWRPAARPPASRA